MIEDPVWVWGTLVPRVQPLTPSCPPCCSREKKELQKILDRKRNNSISEAKTKEKHKKEV